MDSILKSWLDRQHQEGVKLAAESDVMSLHPATGMPPQEYLARFDCPTLVQEHGAVAQRPGFDALIRFPLDYLRCVPNPTIVVALLTPASAYHPNVSPPFMCIGNIAPGTSLCELICQIFDIMTFNKLTPNEHDALNPEACSWARNHMHLFPLTSRPLRRRNISLDIAEIAPEPAQ